MDIGHIVFLVTAIWQNLKILQNHVFWFKNTNFQSSVIPHFNVQACIYYSYSLISNFNLCL